MNDSFLNNKIFINKVSDFFTRVYNEKFLNDYKIDKNFLILCLIIKILQVSVRF